jgi:cytosine deaminase
VAIGHASKLSALRPDRFDAAAKRLADAGVAVTVLPATDRFLMGRDTPKTSRAASPPHKLVAAGVNCSIATNNVLSPFTPFGDCSLIRMANLYANAAQIGDAEGLALCLEMISGRAARLLTSLIIKSPLEVLPISSFFTQKEPADIIAEIWSVVAGCKFGRCSFVRDPIRWREK